MKGAGKGRKGRRTTGRRHRDERSGAIGPSRHGHAGFGLLRRGKRTRPVPHPAGAARSHGGRSPDASSRPFGRGHHHGFRRIRFRAIRTDSGRFPCADTSVRHCPDGFAEGLGEPISRGRADGNPDGFPLLRDPNAEEARMPDRSGLHDQPAGTAGCGSALRRIGVSAKPGSRTAGSPRAGRPRRIPGRRRRPRPRRRRGGSGRPRTTVIPRHSL